MFFLYKPDFPFDLYRSLDDLTRHPFGLTERLDGYRYQTIIFTRLVTVTQNRKTEELSIHVRRGTPALKDPLVKEIRRRFGLKQDMKRFYQFVRDDPHLAPLIKRLKGLTMFQKSTPFEMLVTAITDQQLTVSFATELKRRFITLYGERYVIGDVELWTFPAPATIAKLPGEALRPLQFSGSKSRSIIRLAKEIVAGELPIDEWSKLNDEELLKALMSIYGVGRWTAEYTAMIGYNRRDIVPAADIGLMTAVQRCYQLEERPNEQEVRRIAESWRPWRGLITYYLWHGFE